MTAGAHRFPLFDSLRALAALSIVALHATLTTTLLHGLHLESLKPYTDQLDVGVNIFFVISGFLLYRPFARARLEGQRLPAVGAYAWRRFLRIAPAYWVALTLITLWLSLPERSAGYGIRLYSFRQIYSGETARAGIPQAWTLCVEVTFYAFLPLFALAMRRVAAKSPKRWLTTELGALALLVVFSVAYKAWALGQTDVNSPDAPKFLMPLPNFLDQFALGMALAVMSVAGEARLLRARAREWVVRWQSASWVFAFVALLAAGHWTSGAGVGGAAAVEGDVFPRHFLHAFIAVAVVLPAVLNGGDRSLVRRVLRNRILMWIGLISYSLYLWHMAVELKFAGRLGEPSTPLGSIGLLALMTVAAIAVAAISYYLVERPVLKLRSGPDQPHAAHAPSAPPAT
jgi:peptidoglycan/LPS O-acetylase OafA/YrhL